MLASKIVEVLETEGFYDGRYREYNSEGMSIDSFITDFFYKEKIKKFEIDITRAFESPRYDSAILSVAWIDEEGLHLETFLLESC